MSGVSLGPDPHDNQSNGWEKLTWEDRYHRLDRETSAVEVLICTRTAFAEKSRRGEPYAGWPGLTRALREELDERDGLRKAKEKAVLISKRLIDWITEEGGCNCCPLHDIAANRCSMICRLSCEKRIIKWAKIQEVKADE